jgi:hypothetical protein
MNEKLQDEIVRLVKEIKDDERELVRAQIYENELKIERLTASINRKLELIKILKA